MKKQLVIDGNSILNRAFYGVRPLTNKDGLHTNALFGMINILLRHIENIGPDYLSIAFDLPAPTFRHLSYDGYKANRHGMPAELAEQLPYAKQIASALGMKVLACEGWEADDILGTMAALGEAEAVMTYLLTGDRDSLQLVSEHTHVLLAGNNETAEFDPEAVREKYGVSPRQLIDMKALMGDSSDNIPGVPGIGEKTASQLIVKFGSLDAVYANIDTAGTPSVRKKLAEGKESAYLSLSLADIKIDAPVGISLEESAYSGMKKEELLPLFMELDFSLFIARLGLDKTEEIVEESAENHPETVISPAELAQIPEAGIRLEEGNLYLFDGDRHLRCPFSHIEEIRKIFEDSEKDLVVNDVKKLRSALAAEGISLNAQTFDVMLAAYLLNPAESAYDTPRLTASYLNDMQMPEEEALWRLKALIGRKLDEQQMADLYRQIELPLAYVLSDMEMLGFKVDVEGLNAFGAQLGETAERLTDEIYALSGEVFNINSPKQLGEVLFDKLGLPVLKKNKSGYSTNAEVLEKLRPYHPIIDKIFEFRQVVKLKSTYADGLVKAADETGRIHSSFNQTVTNTGRLSSTEPNLQNIPIRTELGREFRRYFIPSDRDHVLIDADYSQIELRLLAHISGDERMIRTFCEEEDIHTRTAAEVFGVALDEVTADLRKRAKAVNFGIVYGIGDFSLAADIGVTKYEAGQYIKNYLARYPMVAEYMDAVKAQAKAEGFVATMFGRRRYIPEITSSKAQLRAFGERVAMNSPIQGSAADIIKLAMVRTDRALKKSGLDARLILQVHDELIVEAHRDHAEDAAEILRREMENAVKLSVPLTVDLGIGDNWMEGH